jgi:hypothetical protein
MGAGFNSNLDRPNTLEMRDSAERTEKILKRLFELAHSELQFDMGAKTGAQVGRSVFKCYKKGTGGYKHACFTYCQPDYFYGIPAGDSLLGEYATVYYAYPIDILEARRVYGDRPYKTELEMRQSNAYQPIRERANANDQSTLRRRVPVLEIWTKENYALVVGDQVIYNGDNPYKWADTSEGFIPFVVIENIRNSDGAYGESDIEQARELNEKLNYVISRKNHIVGRWLQPTLVWEGAPQNYAEILTATIGGGGAIPARLGARLYFLAYDRPNPAVSELEATLRAAILETAGINEIALQGTVTGSVNTGPALEAQYQPVVSTIGKKQREWTGGLKLLCAMLLQLQEDIGDSKALGQAVVNQVVKSETALPAPEAEGQQGFSDEGTLVELTGKDIRGLRSVAIQWPGVLPKDNEAEARMEMEKASQGFQSIYSTLEKLGEDYPDDEIARIRAENQDPALRGQAVAEQTRANTPLLKQQMEQGQPGAGPGLPPGPTTNPFTGDPYEEEGGPPADGGLGERLRGLARTAQPSFDDTGEEPQFQVGPGGY